MTIPPVAARLYGATILATTADLLAGAHRHLAATEVLLAYAESVDWWSCRATDIRRHRDALLVVVASLADAIEPERDEAAA